MSSSRKQDQSTLYTNELDIEGGIKLLTCCFFSVAFWQLRLSSHVLYTGHQVVSAT